MSLEESREEISSSETAWRASSSLAGLASLVPGLWIAPLLPAALIASRASASLPQTLLLWIYLLWMYGALCIAWWLITRLVFVSRAALSTLAITAASGSIWAVANYGLVWLASKTFSNKELSALLVTVLSLAVAIALIKIRDRFDLSKSSAARAIVGGAITALVWTGLIWHNRAGFGQLDPWTLALPLVVGAITFASRAWLAPRLTQSAAKNLARVGVVSSLGSILCFGAVEISGNNISDDAARFGPITRYVAATTQRFTDFDGDGHSSFMGGADCAPFDASISPDAREVPGDGIDNNCVGGDAKSLQERRAPEPHPLPSGWPEKMNVVVISVEALRPDHIHALGYERETTPNLDKLIEESVVFERFYASSTFTRLSLPSLWTSNPPSRIAWEAQQKTKMPHVAASNPWVPSLFEDSGRTTLAVQTNFPAFTKKDNIGFDRGFTRYNASFPLRYRGGTMRGFPSIPQTDRVVELLEEFSKKPFMLWVHMVEPHYMYEQFPGAPVFGKDRQSLYDAEIWGVDRQIGRIVSSLEKQGMWDNTIIFITGDHGEEFEEHGKRYHGSNLYEPQIRTLGLLRVPGLKPQRIETPVGFSDIGATVLNFANITKGYSKLSGRNLTGALLEQRPLESETVIAEVWDVVSKRGYQLATISWPYKLILSGKGASKRELYDLSKDPGEQKNLWDNPEVKAIQETMLEEATRYMDSSDRTYHDVKKPAP
jgi:arylsulfatase A-like enzyme